MDKLEEYKLKLDKVLTPKVIKNFNTFYTIEQVKQIAYKVRLISLKEDQK